MQVLIINAYYIYIEGGCCLKIFKTAAAVKQLYSVPTVILGGPRHPTS